MVEDKRIEEIKDMMYKAVCNCGYTLQVEAAKAYAMLCMAEQKEAKQSEVATTVDSKKTGWAIEIQEG